MQEKKKVIWIINQYTRTGHTNSRQALLGQELEKRGYRVYIFCAGGKYRGEGNTGDVKRRKPYYKVKSHGSKYIVVNTMNCDTQIKRVLASLQMQETVWLYRRKFPHPDVIISNFSGLFGNGYLRWKKYGTKVIYDILDLWPETFVEEGYLRKNAVVTKMLYQLEHQAYRNADGIIFSCEGGRDYITEKGWEDDVKLDKVGYLNNGISLELIEGYKQQYVLKDADLETGKFTVVYIGAIGIPNNIDQLVDCARVLKQRGVENIQILVYGNGSEENRLKRMIQQKALNNIKMKGYLDFKFAPSVLEKSDIAVLCFRNLPSLRFGISNNKLFLYCAAGKPVLSTVKPKYDLIEKENLGVVETGGPEKLAEQILNFQRAGVEIYDNYRKNCFRIAEKFDYKNLANVLISQIEG